MEDLNLRAHLVLCSSKQAYRLALLRRRLFRNQLPTTLQAIPDPSMLKTARRWFAHMTNHQVHLQEVWTGRDAHYGGIDSDAAYVFTDRRGNYLVIYAPSADQPRNYDLMKVNNPSADWVATVTDAFAVFKYSEPAVYQLIQNGL